PGRELVEPAEARRPNPEIQRKRKTTEDDLGAGQQLVTFLARTGWSKTLAEVALHRPRRPGLAEFDVKPAPSIDHMQASVDRRDTTQSIVGHRHDHQDFSGQHHDLSLHPREAVLLILVRPWPAFALGDGRRSLNHPARIIAHRSSARRASSR